MLGIPPVLETAITLTLLVVRPRPGAAGGKALKQCSGTPLTVLTHFVSLRTATTHFGPLGAS
jgi:hypothetical protein